MFDRRRDAATGPVGDALQLRDHGGPGQVGADLLGRLLEGQAGRPGQDGEDVLVVAGRHPVHPALHELEARVDAGLLVGGGGRHQHEVAVGLGRGLLGELGRVLLGEPVDHLRRVVGLLHGLEEPLGRGGVGVLGHVLRAGALHGLHVGGVVGVRRRRRRVVRRSGSRRRVGGDLVRRLGLGGRDVEVDHGRLRHGVGVGRLEVVGRTERPVVGVAGAGPEDVGRVAGRRRRDLGGHGRDAAGADGLRAAVVEARGVAHHGEVAGAGLLRVGVVRPRVVAVVEGLHLDLAAADAAGAVDVGGPGLGGLLRALGQAGRHAADAGDVADRDGGRRDARARWRRRCRPPGSRLPLAPQGRGRARCRPLPLRRRHRRRPPVPGRRVAGAGRPVPRGEPRRCPAVPPDVPTARRRRWSSCRRRPCCPGLAPVAAAARRRRGRWCRRPGPARPGSRSGGTRRP